jgi:hypothetical protein
MQTSAPGQNAGPDHDVAGAPERGPGLEVAALADDIGHAIAVARALVRQGRRLDLAGLDQRVGRLCAQTLDLGPEPARRMRPRLLALMTELERLDELLAPPGSDGLDRPT